MNDGKNGNRNSGGESYEYVPLGEYVVRAPGVCDGGK